MKFLLLTYLTLFTMGATGQVQQQAPQDTDPFDMCSFLTDLSFYHRYQALHVICHIRGYIEGQVGMVTIPSEQCFGYLQEQILSKEPKTQEELMSLMARYMSDQYRNTRSGGLRFYWFSLEQRLGAECGMTIDLGKELSVEQQMQKEQQVFESVRCISQTVDLEKQKQGCTVDPTNLKSI